MASSIWSERALTLVLASKSFSNDGSAEAEAVAGSVAGPFVETTFLVGVDGWECCMTSSCWSTLLLTLESAVAARFLVEISFLEGVDGCERCLVPSDWSTTLTVASDSFSIDSSAESVVGTGATSFVETSFLVGVDGCPAVTSDVSI